MHRRILGSVHDNEKENWRILTNKEIYAVVRKPTITETIRIISSTNFNAQFSLFVNNMFATLLSSTCFEH